MKIVVLLAFAQGVLRTYFGFAYAGVLGIAAKEQAMSLIETPVSNEMLVIAAPFLLLGVLGLATTAGLAMRKPWGAYGTLIVSTATIAYDLWAFATIQCSAMIGLIVPVICILYLIFRRDVYRSARAVRA